jgi:hypothetical protein
MTKAETVAELLRCFREAQEDCISGPDGLRGTGDRSPGMGQLWKEAEPSFRELERCLTILKDERRSQFWHVAERYLRAETRRLKVRVVRKGKNVIPKMLPHTELVNRSQPVYAIAGDGTADVLAYSWDKAVDNVKVEHGVEFICREFRGTPYLPAAVFERVAA